MNAAEIFVGRRDELARIDRLVADVSKNYFLVLVGVGGVGKTWLLRRVYEKYRHRADVVVMRIDYAETRAQTMPTLSRYVIEQFSAILPAALSAKILDQVSGQESLAKELNQVELAQAEDLVYRAVVREASRAISPRRLIILSDTVEANDDIVLEDRINALAGSFNNAVVVVAGRPYASVVGRIERLPNILPSNWEIQRLNLDAFKEAEVNEYLSSVLPDSDLETDLRDKIALLTGRSPVLVAIAGEWLRRNYNLPPEVDLSMEELRALSPEALAEKRQRFQFALVDIIRRLDDRLAWAVLYLAYLDRRPDKQLLQIAFDGIDEQELEQITAELGNLVFVRKSMRSEKEGFLLHDEAKQLIVKHVWEVVDHDRTLRKKLAQKVVEQYYRPRITDLQGRLQAYLEQQIERFQIGGDLFTVMPQEQLLKFELEIECLDYCSRISDNDFLSYLDELYAEIRTTPYLVASMEFLEQALHSVKPYLDNDPRIMIRRAEVWIDKDRVSAAMQEARRALQSAQIAPDEAVRAYIILAKGTADLSQRLAYLTQAQDRVPACADPMLRWRVLKEFGLVYRQQGKWSLAADSYHQVLRQLDSRTDANEYAATLNNLAFVIMLTGDSRKADTWAEKALRIRKETGNVQGQALSYSTKGRIAETFGYYSEAIRYHQLAVKLAQAANDIDNATRARLNIVVAERRAHRFDAARSLLAPGLGSERVDIRARALYEDAQIDFEEARTMRGESRASELFNSAENKALEALEISKKIGDCHQTAQVLFYLALLHFISTGKESLEYISELQALLNAPDTRFPLEEARLVELKADFDYARGEYLAAFGGYTESCKRLADYSPASFRQTYNRVRDKYLSLNREQAAVVHDQFGPQLRDVPSSSPLAELSNLFEDEWAL